MVFQTRFEACFPDKIRSLNCSGSVPDGLEGALSLASGAVLASYRMLQVDNPHSSSPPNPNSIEPHSIHSSSGFTHCRKGTATSVCMATVWVMVFAGYLGPVSDGPVRIETMLGPRCCCAQCGRHAFPT